MKELIKMHTSFKINCPDEIIQFEKVFEPKFESIIDLFKPLYPEAKIALLDLF